ncbi:nicotinate phosphoribosyltransferase [Fusarium napiforme]|uniref:Nicotinate phosphoribosyltransferase n=1 Tax=Fusarium napiforme TaxID=42672 RepID=A0A8H5NB59_9HYPO|nr:nicotinate phosphoribosyltransferase [Fusarium napiforme]
MLTYLGFAILGLVNAIVPFIVHSANYLIIPYPRWIVLLIETLPALATKLLMPHVLHRVPYWMRPLTVGAGWIIVAIVTNVTPPNIAPPLRILTSVLASISAAAMEVSFLGMLRYYGRVGLAGWGAGVGAGAVFCAILPFVLTVWLESFLRDFIDCIYALTGAMLVAFFVVLPGAPVNYPHAQQEVSKVDVEDASLLAQDPAEQLSRMLSTRNRLNLTKAMVRPFMVPLFEAFAIQALAYPGIARALPLPTTYTSFFSYFTTYGLAFQLGSFISRTHTLLFRSTSTKVAFTVIGASTFILLTNSIFLIFSAEVLVGLLAFGAGLGGGAVYMTIFDRVLQDRSFESGINLEFGLQIVGAGETAGVILASLAIMMKRRTHNKSRHGCRNCKKRHVKCDEGGPPCTNCLARNLEGCSYLTEPPTQLPATETRRRIELELMHRWTSSSYKSLASIPEDNKWLQDDMARWALKHEYLLQGMFAFSALEVALCGGAVVVEEDHDTYYAKLAVEYYDKASRSFRAQLENVNSENAQKIFMFSFLAVAVNMALGQCSAFEELHEGVLERMVTLWELLMGNASIANQHFDALISGALSRSTEALMLRTQLQTETPTSLSKETEEALESLSTIISKACETPSGSTPNDQSEASVRTSSYRTSFSAIQTCFVQDSKDVFQGMAIGFPALAGREFGLALKSSDPVALLLMVFWGVQLDTLGKIAWWVGTFGKKMVDEVSEMLWEPDPEFEVMNMSEWRECIAWARTEVGLTPIVETTEE